MEDLKRLFSKVRWTSVLALIVVIVVVALILLNLPSRYSVQGNIGVTASADPRKVKIGERSTIEIEVKNLDENEEARISIEAQTHDESFVFVKSGTKYAFESDVLIGPEESRKVKFDVRALTGSLPGKYRVDVTAKPENYNEGAKDVVYITVSED